MSTALTKTIRYTLGVVGLVIVLLLAAPFFIDINSYKGEIEKKVEDATGRKLVVGNISASLFPWVGVELDDVRLANRSGFSSHDFVSVQKLHVKLALLPLLSKSIEIKHFEVVAPQLYLERHENGDTNWGDLAGQAPASAAAAAPVAPATGGKDVAGGMALVALQAESLSLTDGELTWVDGKEKPVALTELAVMLKDVQLKRPVSVTVSGKLSGNPFELDANVGPIGDLATINPASLPLQGHLKAENIHLQPFAGMISGWPAQLGDVNSATVGLTANIEQHPDGLRLGEGSVSLDAAHKLALSWKVEMPNADMLKIGTLALAVDSKSLLAVNGSLQKLSTKPAFQLHVETQPITRSWLTPFVPALQDLYGAHPAPWTQLALNALLAGNADHLDISDMQLMLDQDVLKLTGAVAFAGPDIRLRINGKQLHMDPWLPQGQAEQKSAALTLVPEAVAVEAPAEPDLRFLKSWRVTTQLNVATVYLRGLEMGDFGVTINGMNGQFELNPLSFTLAGGKVVEKASLNAATYPASWKESVHMTGVQAGPLLKALAGMDLLSGTMAMDTQLKATGLTQSAVQALNGRGSVLFKDGALKGYDIAGAIRAFTNPAAAANGPQQTDFAQLSGSFDIVNGVATNPDLFMASPLLRVTGKGVVDLVRKVLDYHVEPRVVGTLKGQGDTVLRQGLVVPLHITGPFDAPSIKPEINAKTLIDNAPALLNNPKIGGALGGLLGGSKKSADPAQPAAPTQQPAAPAQQLLKGFGGMLPRF
ncbi:AsmA family protein [Mariprofundus erugo]|uniref:AsmA family protein n=1 Tax=Mariprofundus erugo TaxID=2528639 RepID=A0A5R9GRB2_9PROT|nr:AsmA family protein [Mariprofundus erugo]TLS65724.1 AsmA family protein [Mariprofundus erugo]